MAALIVGALLLGVFALLVFSPNQFEYENEQEGSSTRAVARALNAALAAAGNPERTLEAFIGGLGTADSIKYFPGSSAADRPVRAHTSKVPAWFIALLPIPELNAAYPIKIGSADVGNVVFDPDLSADIFEKWMGFLAIITTTSMLMLLAAFSAYLTTGTALRPLAQLGAGLTRMRNGDFETAIPVAGPPEIRGSCEEANQLAATLRRLSRDNRELLRKLVSVQDDERRELARELHDEMGPLLFAIRANATALSEQATDGLPEPGSPAEGILSAAEALQRANRRILEGLSPLYVAELGLDESIRALLRDAQSQAPTIRLTSMIAPRLNDLDGLFAQTTYRVIQEGVTNVLKHAQATTIDVMANIDDEKVAIEISDDGVGLPQRAGFGRGLTGMHERVRALNGTFELSRENGRTVVRCRLPLDHEVSA
jgi:two-component system, NarL family, sensor histidine kinase UhpB